ncbi:hypothetical protein PI125_g17865 [Phytophthora idaei]|nr:hypothetical protein PI125_g17865 [Phytophthora idaei]
MSPRQPKCSHCPAPNNRITKKSPSGISTLSPHEPATAMEQVVPTAVADGVSKTEL